METTGPRTLQAAAAPPCPPSSRGPRPDGHLQMAVGQNETTRGPQVLVHVSIYQDSIWVHVFNRYQNGILASGNMDQNLRSPGGLILTHTQLALQGNGLNLGALWPVAGRPELDPTRIQSFREAPRFTHDHLARRK